MIRYDIYNLEHSSDFAIGDVSFQQVNDYKDRVEVWKKEEENQKEKTDQFTFRAIISDEKPQRSMLYPEGKITTTVDDMMILLSLAQSRNVFYAKAEDTVQNSNWIMPLGGNRKAWGVQFIIEAEIESFLSVSLTQIHQYGWLEKTGFTPAVFWWLESIYEGRPLEIKFVAGFIALEILANIHANSKRIRNSGVEERIKALSNSYGWSFMDNTLVKDWTDIRDKYMHAGRIRSLKRFSKDKALLGTRFFQLMSSMQIVLIDLLGFTNFARREYVISEIVKPIRNIRVDGSPSPIPT